MYRATTETTDNYSIILYRQFKSMRVRYNVVQALISGFFLKSPSAYENVVGLYEEKRPSKVACVVSKPQVDLLVCGDVESL